MLDWVPAELRVIRTTRPKYACRTCETVPQAPAAERPIAGGLATPALLAQVLVSKYCDHTPLYRQAQIFARHGTDLPRSTLAGWVGGACWWLEALHDRLARNVFASDHLFADDMPVPVLDPGRGEPRRDGCGSTPASKGRGADRSRRPRSIFMRPTAKPNARPRISSGSAAFFMSTAMPALSRLRREGTSFSRLAGAIRDASSTTSRRPRTRRSPSRRCAGSANSTPSKWRLTDSRLHTGLPLVALAPSQSSTLCTPGSTRSFRCCRDGARSPRRSVTRWRTGKRAAGSEADDAGTAIENPLPGDPAEENPVLDSLLEPGQLDTRQRSEALGRWGPAG
jgi:transposase